MIVPFSVVTLLMAAYALAAPSSGLVRRTCGLGPSYIDILNVTAPNQPSSTYTQFTLTRDGNPVSNTQIVAMTFDLIPPSATGCRLQITIPQLTQPNQIAWGSATQAEFWTTDPWYPNTPPTWNNLPAKREMVATFGFPTYVTNSVFQTNLASNVCTDPMSYLILLSNWQTQAGGVDFYNSLGGKQGLEVLGFEMIFDC
ncbi:uncharacterized protein N7482_008359 [Penicillium canariense]|uniref:Ubiquitin 3 binding protein But2 C-terminal domain-containing protein n=1 Tax=Penicillium canariense TaxID=189055 RepID=A0A9W9LI95_9EURO|nr:uncharacterized protein N7482_008359 [Penicillium canariense]KAJ5157259.1 hypothetical protein N7482_008359 [Penicillium canariense]